MKKGILWIIGGILGAVIVVLLGVVLFFALLFENIGQNTVVRVLPSPDGTLEARIIDSDQGAMGGATIVEVEKNGWAKPKQIYTGPWGIFETMEIYWKDEDTLVINGKEYRVD
jgi:hypothetical protein